ncbi:MAG: hypothetical protein V7K88_02330 [Nostoc sp.]|uniref:hypothetical protein n=1 Tax=Nostoc sp. TaxID=1180 RepID=UPI002FF58C41
MSRPRRNFQPGFCYHITTRCNNREFRLTRLECREVFLYAIKKAQQRYGFKLYALWFAAGIAFLSKTTYAILMY